MVNMHDDDKSWPRKAYETILRASGLALTPAQVKGVSIITQELVDKFLLQHDEDEDDEEDSITIEDAPRHRR